MKNIITLLLFTFSYSVYAQVPEPALLFLKGIGGGGISQVLTKVTKTSDGGFVMGIQTTAAHGTGNIDSFCALSGGRNIFLKYNADATVLEWSKCYEYDGDTLLLYYFPQNDGGVVLGGEYNSANGWGFYISKHDAAGNIMWSHGYSKGNSLGLTCMISTDDGGYLMGGSSFFVDTNVNIHYGGSFESDIFLLKVDSNGNKQWGKVIGGTADDYVYHVVKGPDNGYYAVGSTLSTDFDCTGSHGDRDAYVARLDSNGSLLWHRDLGGSGAEAGTYAVVDGNGGIVVSAHSPSVDGDLIHHVNVGENIWIVNLDSVNHILWDKCYGGGGDCYPNSICRAVDKSIWIAGVSNTPVGEIDTTYGREDAWFIHADSLGNFISAKVLGSSQDDVGTMVHPLSNGNIIGGGFFRANDGAFQSTEFYGGWDAFLVEFLPWQTEVGQIRTPSNKIKVYPNPAIDNVSIIRDNHENYRVVISDVLGRVVYKSSKNGSIEVSLEGWTKGLYCISIAERNGNTQSAKFLVQ